MGCDIHQWFEVRKNGKWEPAEVRIECDYHEGPDCYRCDGTTRAKAGDRHYDVFAVLAGVRNDEDVVPIAEPRGFPADMAQGHEGDVCGWFPDDSDPDLHDCSWLTLRELLDNIERIPEGELRDKVIPEMQKLGSPDDVRMIFAFDN